MQAKSYDSVHKALHWIVFALLAAQFAVGFLMPHIRRDTPMEGLVAWHVSLGTAILFFLFVRVLWRLARPVPMDETLPTWQRHLAALTHGMLYLLVLVMVVLGWSAAGFYDWTVRLFGAVTLPRLAPKGAEWAHEAGDIHNTLVWVLLGFIALHVVAALYHHLVLRDRVMQRMLPGT
jgi:cytochrome b561